jgi:hypothetical protein
MVLTGPEPRIILLTNSRQPLCQLFPCLLGSIIVLTYMTVCSYCTEKIKKNVEQHARADIVSYAAVGNLGIATMQPEKGGHLFFTCNLPTGNGTQGSLLGRNTGSSDRAYRLAMSPAACAQESCIGLSGEPAYDQHTNHNHDENRHLRIGAC